MMLLTLRGTPFLYQGEEIGQSDGEVPPDRIVDIHGRDPERTPMQWRAGPGAGFTTGEPWLPIGMEADRVNVAAQLHDPASMLSFYRRLIWYRRGSLALRAGSYRPLDAGPDVYAYVREADGERLLVALNFAAREVVVDGAALGLPGSGELELSTSVDRRLGRVVLDRLRLAPDEGVIVRLAAPGADVGRGPQRSS